MEGSGNNEHSDDGTSRDTLSDGSENESINVDEESNGDFDKTEFKNWVRGVKSLEYMQHGLAPFVDREIAIKHNMLLKKLNVSAHANAPCSCTFKKILPDHEGGPCNRQNKSKCPCQKPSHRRRCPNNICSKLYDCIVVDHRFTNPSFGNSDIGDWTCNTWGIAKWFLADTKSPSNSAKTTDASGLLNIIINANFFQHKLTCQIDPPNDIFSKARGSRNELMHKSPMELTGQELHDLIDLFISVLQDSSSLLQDQDAILAVNNLLKLKNNQIHIGLEEKKAIVKDTLKRINEEKMKALDEIVYSKDSTLQAIDTAETKTMKKLEKYEVDANTVKDLATQVKKNKEDILALTNRAVARSESEPTKAPEDDGEQSDGDDEENIPSIPTDVDDRRNIEDETVELRAYQEELAKKGCDGHNVIVLAPTNTGKTRVACKIIQDHFRRRTQIGEFGKVIFLVHTEPLAFQQGQQCAKLLPYYRTKVITGRVQREKNQLLKDFVERRDILVVTAQVLVNALKLKEIRSMREFSLVVIDECHHTQRAHSFSQAMARYIDLKLNDNVALPQVVGMTASIGVGGNKDYSTAKEYMKGLLVQMDTHYLCTVRANLEQLRDCANRAKEYKIVTRKRPNDNFRQAVQDIVIDIDIYMANHPSIRRLPNRDDVIKDLCRVPLYRGTEKFIQWLSRFHDGIANLRSEEAIRMLNPCRLHLETYNQALMLHSDAQVCDALAVLEEFMQTEKATGNETDDMLLHLYSGLMSKTFDNLPANPKLNELENILLTNLTNKEDRCIIFAKSIILVEALTKWINDTEKLQHLNAKEFLGRKKMSRLNQKDALEYFTNGRHKVIVATSVAEEGLDIVACNLVIRYEHVKNEIVRLQSRGRARAKESKYYIITEEGSSLLEKEEENEMLEKLMDRIIPELGSYIEENPDRWLRELRQLQEERKAMMVDRERILLANMSNEVKRLHCLNCNKFICMSSDIRKVLPSHHIAIEEDVLNRVTIIRNPDPKYKDDKMKSDGHIFCSRCERILGGVLEFEETEFPLIKITFFRIVDRLENGKRFRKWKDVTFRLEQISFTELSRVVQIRDDYTY